MSISLSTFCKIMHLSHIRVEHDDPQFLEAGKEHGFDIRVIFQPSNSPNFDIVDLGISRAIQAIEIKKDAKKR